MHHKTTIKNTTIITATTGMDGISVIGATGSRQSGDFLQKRVSDKTPFPCRTKGYRSKTVPTSVHQLRPGIFLVLFLMFFKCIFLSENFFSWDFFFNFCLFVIFANLMQVTLI